MIAALVTARRLHFSHSFVLLPVICYRTDAQV